MNKPTTNGRSMFLAAVLLAALCTSTIVFGETDTHILDKTTYMLGESLTINLPDQALSILITKHTEVGDKTIKLLGVSYPQTKFTPSTTGNYRIDFLEESTGYVVSSQEFSVRKEALPESSQPTPAPLPHITIRTDKSTYTTDETATITISPRDQLSRIRKLEFRGPRGSVAYLGTIQHTIPFKPSITGTWSIVALGTDDKEHITAIEVKDGTAPIEKKEESEDMEQHHTQVLPVMLSRSQQEQHLGIYQLGTKVLLPLSQYAGPFDQVLITTANTSFTHLGDSEKDISFYPKNPGSYSVEAIGKNTEVTFRFVVLPVAEEYSLQFHREQASGVGPGRIMIVTHHISNPGSNTATNITLQDMLPVGWKATSTSPLIHIDQEPDESEIVKITIPHLESGDHASISYTLHASFEEGEYTFITKYQDELIHNQTVNVESDRSFFEAALTIPGSPSRTIGSKTYYPAEVTIRNIGDTQEEYPVFLYWVYDQSDITINSRYADDGCGQAKNVHYNNQKALHCIWQPFLRNETKKFTVWIEAKQNADSTLATWMNITYDPPMEKDEQESKVSLMSSFFSFFKKIFNWLKELFSKEGMSGITGDVVAPPQHPDDILTAPSLIDEQAPPDEEAPPEPSTPPPSDSPAVSAADEPSTAPETPSQSSPSSPSASQRRGLGKGSPLPNLPDEDPDTSKKKQSSKIWYSTRQDIILFTEPNKDDYQFSMPFTIKLNNAQGEPEQAAVKKLIRLRNAKYDLEFDPTNHPIKKLRFTDLVIKEAAEFELGLDEVSPSKLKIIKGKNVIRAFALDPTRLNFTNATFTFTATGSSLMKCAEWDFENQACTGEWSTILTTIPGTEYTVSFTSLDPGYAETGVASVNTKKPVYHPQETVDIIAVVLDTNGHLVSGADVTIQVTTISGASFNYSTQAGTVTQSSRGIYEAHHVETSTEGTYALSVHALGRNVNNSMHSFFLINSSYPFDIVRQTPVTTDPWRGSFNSSITITSLTNITQFNFTEIVPLNFTIYDAGGASVTSTNNMWELLYTDIVNGSTISYTARPPLVTPDLYTLGPSRVTYEQSSYEEARPWYLAIDPQGAWNYTSGSDQGYTNQDNAWDSVNDQYATRDVPKKTVDTTNYLIGQLNNVPDLGGTITSVEIGVEGYGESGDIEVRLIPIFGGSLNGDEYVITASTFGGSDDDSIDYVDVTTDGNAPSWTWAAVQAMDVKLYVKNTNNGQARTVYVDQLYARVDYILDSTPPTVTLNTPETGTWQSTLSVNFTFNTTTNDDYNSCSVWTNESGWSSAQSNQSAIVNDTTHGILTTFSGEADYVWNVQCSDTTGNSAFGSSNRTVRIDTTSPLVVNLTAPGHASTSTNLPLDFNFTANDTRGVANCSLWTNSSGTWQQNATVFSPINNQETNFTVSPVDGHHKWNVICFDNIGNSDWFTNNYTVIIDTSAPVIYLESPENNSAWVSSSTVDFTFNVTDLSPLANCSLTINGLHNKTNDTAINKGTGGQIINQTLGNANYKWNITCADIYGQTSTSLTYNVTVNYNPAPSIITVTYPANSSYTNKDPVPLNSTTNEISDCKYSTNPSFNYASEGTVFDTTGLTNHNADLGSLGEGRYTYYIKCNNVYEFINNESNMGSATFTVDRTDPGITLNAPNNNANYSETTTSFNWTAVDQHADSSLQCNLTIDGNLKANSVASANNTMVNYSVTMTNGTHQWNVTCWDDAGNTNTSLTRTLHIDGDGPVPLENSISAIPGLASAGAVITITANVSDAYSDVSEVYVNVTLETTGTNYFYQMTPLGSDQYQYSFGDTSTADTYEFTIWANDTAMPTPNYRNSSVHSFTIAGINAIIGIQTNATNYKQDKYVNITSTYSQLENEGSSGTLTSTTKNEDHSRQSCSDAWGFSCGGTGDDTFDSCPQGGADSNYQIRDVYINASKVVYTGTVLVSCEFDCAGVNDPIYIYYRNSTGNWHEISTDNTCDSTDPYNETLFLEVDNIAGEHQVRCIIDKNGNNDECSESGGTGSNEKRFDNDDVNFTVLMVDEDGTTDSLSYSNFGSTDYSKLTDIDIFLEISDYNYTASQNASNSYPDVEIYAYDGSDYPKVATCDASSLSSLPANCTVKLMNDSILTAWANTANRIIQLKGINLDYAQGISDSIDYNDLYVEFETPSKTENYGLLNMSSTLLMRIDYLNGSSWQEMSTIYNSGHNLSVNQSIDISTLWNNNPWFTNSYTPGTYRAYSALTDAGGSVLQNQDGTYLNDTYLFNVSYLRLLVQSPANNSEVDATSFWANITLQYTYHPSGGWCVYSLDNTENRTMQNDTATHFYNVSAHTYEGSHSITFYCNDTDDDISYAKTEFTASDQTGPLVNLSSPLDGAEEVDGNITFFYNVTDTATNISNCTLEFQFSDNQVNLTVTEGILQNFTMTDLASGGPYFWRVYCYDNSSNRNIGYSSYWDFIVGADNDDPVITLYSPQDGHNTTNNDVTFRYRANDLTSDLANCSLILNGTINKTDPYPEEQGGFPYVFNNFTVNNMPDADYEWMVNCTDESGNVNVGNSSTRLLSVRRDTDFPAIYLTSPDNDYTDTDGDVIFIYNVTDASSNIANCSLLINGTVNKTITSPSEGQNNQIAVPGFIDGSYNWQINCTDDSADLNTNSSEIRNFTVNIVSAMYVSVSTDSPEYEQGTQSNESATITTSSTDTLSNPLNTSATVDIISGNTSLRWWNTDWKRRKPIYINETDGRDRTNSTIFVNVTGLSGFISNCTKEIRVIRNDSLSQTEIPYSILSGDNSEFCEIIFSADLTADAVNNNNHYVYFNNSAASAPSYSSTFNLSDRVTGSSGSFIGNFPNSGGVVSDTHSYNRTYWYGGSNANFDSPNGNFEIVFDTTAINLSEDKITRLDLNISYCHSGEDTTPDCDGDDPIEGTIQGTQDVYLYNYDTGTWTDIGNLNPNNNELRVNSTYLVTNSLSSYINDTTKEVTVRYELNYTNSNGLDSWLVIDYATLHLHYTAQVYSASVGETSVHINRSSNETGTDGSFAYEYSTNGLSQGWYSAVALTTASSYSNATNHTSFEIIGDSTAPSVTLVSPLTGNISYTGNITLYYNVTDALSGILNCSLVLNNTINQTNTSISESQKLNFSLSNLANGDYVWTVNCTDDSSNQNIGTKTPWTFSVAVDTTPPTVALSSPANGYNDTNGQIDLSYTVNDVLTTTADCVLYINDSANATHSDVTADGSTYEFEAINLTDGDFSWYVNCTDDSIARNWNTSFSRNFTVIIDEVGPVIKLESPDDDAHITAENVTLFYNVSDIISNITSCSLYINGSLNQTNTTVLEDTSQNFTLTYLGGSYSWYVNCTDGSENANFNVSETRTFKVAPDVTGPDIYLEFPPEGIELPPGNITFFYNVTDKASAVANCSLYIDNKWNQTNTSIQEDVSQNFTVYDMGNGDYTWFVNCTDDSTNYNYHISEIRNLTIGIDETPPQVTLASPVPGHNDTDGSLLFVYQGYDIASDISNCSLIINGTINQTNTTINESVYQNFSLTGITDGSYSWNVNCTDESDNVGNSSTRFFKVANDNTGPVISLSAPANNTLDTDGGRTFSYTVDDAISGITSCSIIIDGKINKTNTTVSEGPTQYFIISGFENGIYQWYVNCTDNSDNLNINSSEMRYLNVTLDYVGPVVSLINPQNNTLETDGNRTFFFNVSDAITNVSSCDLIFNGEVQDTNENITEDTTLNFTLTDISNGQKNWSINCTDTSENSNVGSSQIRNLTVILDFEAPVVSLEWPLNFTQVVSNNITFKYNVTDTLGIANCSIYINGTLNQTNTTVDKSTSQNFTVNNMVSGTYTWQINCTDLSENRFTGSSELRLLIAGPDIVGPNVTLLSPPDGVESTASTITFTYNVTDFASGIENCSLWFNETINQTNTTVVENIEQQFIIEDIPNGNYSWFVQCYDNSTNYNTGTSLEYNITIGKDETPPVITVISPKNNTVVNSATIAFIYSANDYASNVSNCSLYFNGDLNQTDTTIEEEVNQYFYLHNMVDGAYNYSISCIDNSNQTNQETTGLYNISVFVPRPILVDIYLNQSSYEQGKIAPVTVNVTNASLAAFNASIYSDIIKGNTTAPFWNSNWAYRIPIDVNTTNQTRKYTLIELSINFTDVLANSLDASNLTFDNNSVRLIEWAANSSKEVRSTFTLGSGYDTTTSAHGTVRWILNGTTSSATVRNYFIYFDTLNHGSKSATSYTDDTTISFSGTKRSVTYDGSSTSASFMTISSSSESIQMRLDDGQDITNQQNIDYQGAGSIYNITINSTRLSNMYDSIIPIAIYDNNYLTTGSAVTVNSGPVYTEVIVYGHLNNSPSSAFNLTYHIWFGDNEIYTRSYLEGSFGAENTDPQSYFNTLWYAYLFDYESNWNNYIRYINSSTMSDTHQWHAPILEDDTTNQFKTGSWYTEYQPNLGSASIYLEKGMLNDVLQTVGVITLDDFYNPAMAKTTESDGAGFNLNYDIDIGDGDRYNVTAWMVFSLNSSPSRGKSLSLERENPVTITQLKAQELINRTTGYSGVDGLLHYNFSTANKNVGWYSAVAFVNKSLYLNGADNFSFQISIDTTPPEVSLLSPGRYTNDFNITFVYYPTDSNTIDNCSLIINNKINVTNKSITIDANNTFTIPLATNYYNWSVNCTDAAGNVGNATPQLLTVDQVKPSITLYHPGNGDDFNETTLTLNFSVSDNYDTNLSCYITLDGEVNESVYAATGSIANITLYNLTQAEHEWNISCTDDSGNTNTSETRTFLIDLGPPSVTLISPEDYTYQYNENLTFVYSVSDLGTIPNCSLILDNKINQTNNTISKVENNNFTLTGIPEGVHTWTVNCSDQADNIGTGTPQTFTIDQTKPRIDLEGPAFGYNSSSSSVTVNFTVIDNLDDALLCNITVNGTVWNSGTISALNGSVANYTITGLTDASFDWNVTCWDNASNMNISVTRTFTVAEPPSIALGDPANKTWTRNSSYNFWFTATDNSGAIDNCTLIFNDEKNKTILSVTNGTQHNISTSLDDGKYVWTVNCTDPAGATGTNTSLKILYRDTTGPNVTLNYPTDSIGINDQDITFNFTATDALSLTMTCNLTLDGVVNLSLIPATNGSDIIRTIANLTLGHHYWNVTCWDSLNNSAISDTEHFIVNVPDLIIATANIAFNDSSPTEFETIRINATIGNIGGITAEYFVVRFYDGKPVDGGSQIGSDIEVTNLNSGENTTLNVNWTASLDLHEIWVLLDVLNNITEISESNNNNSRNITIPIWNYVTGNATGTLELSDESYKIAYNWVTTNATNSNIYAVDSDSSITWSQLKALTINISNETSTLDLPEFDIALNMTNFTDNMNKSFTYNSTPLSRKNYTVYGKTIEDVPVVNSTNLTSFKTGILWDTADANPGEYNGTQDVILISTIQDTQNGTYGYYNFEIRVPARLREYIKPNNKNTVTFYVELK